MGEPIRRPLVSQDRAAVSEENDDDNNDEDDDEEDKQDHEDDEDDEDDDSRLRVRVWRNSPSWSQLVVG